MTVSFAPTAPAIDRDLIELRALIGAGRLGAAVEHSAALVQRHPHAPRAWLAAGDAYQRAGMFGRLLTAVERAAALAPADVDIELQLVSALILCRQIGHARQRLTALERRAVADPVLLQRVAALYRHAVQYGDAHRCHQRGVELDPRNPELLYNLASSSVAIGQIDQAEALYDRVIELNPDDVQAYVNRSTLRTWRTDRHHVDQLLAVLARLPQSHPGQVGLRFALAKELEDLGDYERSFSFLSEGAQRRRQQMAYRVEDDVAALDQIRSVFTADVLSHQAPAAPAERSCFVLGLPRSGTTLVERILDSHSQVGSLGEIETFALALIEVAAGAQGKRQLIERSVQIDHAQLGAAYRDGVASYGRPERLLIDKTPANYLYLGLIHLSLPGARVIHLRRHPMDSCYAMYKMLFQAGYPFSYSLDDLGRYYVAYHRLMAHWRELIPSSFVDVDYETLVERQEDGTRRLLAYCDLPWEDACLQFHRNDAPAASASAVQIRQPVYRSSVQRWRVYERQLAPLAEYLTRHGIDCA